MWVAVSQVGYAEEAKRLAQRTFLPGSEAGGFGQNDVGVVAGLAWQAQEEVGRCLDGALAMLSAIASQAFFVTDRAAPPELAETLATVRAHFPPVTDSQTFGAQLQSLMMQFRTGIYVGPIAGIPAEAGA